MKLTPKIGIFLLALVASASVSADPSDRAEHKQERQARHQEHKQARQEFARTQREHRDQFAQKQRDERKEFAQSQRRRMD